MEQKELARTNSHRLSTTHTNSISVYRGELTSDCIIECNLIVKQAFPSLDVGFFTHFNRLIKEDKFSDDRLRKAVDHVIRSCVYPQPTVAQFLSYDKRIKLYCYNELVKMTDTNRNIFEDYNFVESLGKYAHINDIEQWDLKAT